MRPTRIKRSSPSAARTTLGKRQLEQLIEEAIVDAYGESEQRVGFLTMLDDKLAFPFEIEILGAPAIVEGVDLNDAEDIVAICRRDKHKQMIPILNLPLPSPLPDGFRPPDSAAHRAGSGRHTRPVVGTPPETVCGGR
jgi:Calcium binding